MDSQIIIAVVGSLTSVIVALIRFRGASKQVTGSSTNPIIWIILIILLNIVSGVSAIAWVFAGIIDTGESTRDYNALLEEAKEKRPYVLESVIAHIKLIDSKTMRTAEVRISYIIRAFRDIKEEEGLFVEEFRLNPKKIPEHWYGSNREEHGNDISNHYVVTYSAKKGEIKTIVTGATYHYPLPMGSDRVIPDGVTVLKANEDYYMYLNSEDYIGNLVVLIESSTTKLDPVERGAFRLHAGQPTKRFDSFYGGRFDSKKEDISISSNSYNLRPGEHGGVIYSWR